MNLFKKKPKPDPRQKEEEFKQEFLAFLKEKGYNCPSYQVVRGRYYVCYFKNGFVPLIEMAIPVDKDLCSPKLYKVSMEKLKYEIENLEVKN